MGRRVDGIVLMMVVVIVSMLARGKRLEDATKGCRLHLESEGEVKEAWKVGVGVRYNLYVVVTRADGKRLKGEQRR